jgi:predicted pyridoxine 5'-phosphate oxidase superfamily flavin-nucleotide-binding protein
MIKNITSKQKQIIENNPIAFSTVDDNNKPSVIAVASVKVVSDNQILITDNFMKQTNKNLVTNNNVCLAVWDKDWNGYKISGTAEYFIQGKWKKFIENIPENKGFSTKGAILINIQKLEKLN